MGRGKVIHMALLCMLALIVAIAALNDPLVKIADAADDALLPRQFRRAWTGLRTRLGLSSFCSGLRCADLTALNAPLVFCRLLQTHLTNSRVRIHPFIHQLCNPHHAPPLPYKEIA